MESSYSVLCKRVGRYHLSHLGGAFMNIRRLSKGRWESQNPAGQIAVFPSLGLAIAFAWGLM